MAQLALFDPPDDRTLLDDASGRITYARAVAPPAEALAWFEALCDGVPWKAERRVMYDREVDVPRLVASYRLAEIRERARNPRAEAARVALRGAEAVVSSRIGIAFDSVGLNRYRDGRDSVAPHNDHLDELAPGFPIALLSLGHARRMTIRSKRPPARVLHVELEPGSLLSMSYETQLHWDHGIPKTNDPVGPRISLAFRVRPKSAGGRYA